MAGGAQLLAQGFQEPLVGGAVGRVAGGAVPQRLQRVGVLQLELGRLVAGQTRGGLCRPHFSPAVPSVRLVTGAARLSHT